MRHAIIKNGAPEIFTGKMAVAEDGTQTPIGGLTSAEKLALGVYEVARSGDIPTGHIQTGWDLVLGDGVVIEQPATRVMTQAEARLAMVRWIDGLTAQVMATYPVTIQARWQVEEAAARAVKAGTATTAQTSLVTAEGQAKDRTPEEHADAIIANADRFHAIAGEINKLFLATDKALAEATDPAQYELILEGAIAAAAPLATAYGLEA